MKVVNFIIFIFSLSLVSCEDIIDINLNDADPKLVIVGEVNNTSESQQVTIGRTVSFSSETVFDPVSGAVVQVTDESGRVFQFLETEPGIYTSQNLRGREQRRYDLYVRIGDQEYRATSTMPRKVTVDSVGTSMRDFFGEEQKFISLKFQDPPNVANYYRYLMKVNESPYKFIFAVNDKYNDGNYVNHDLYDLDRELQKGDQVTVRMQCLDKAAFDYWNSIQAINPGSATPANPISNISNDALGYFSAYSMSELATEVL